MEPKEFMALKRDYESSLDPKWDDAFTKKTLDNIVQSIQLGKYTLNDFYDFVKANLEEGDFAWGCWHYVRDRV